MRSLLQYIGSSGAFIIWFVFGCYHLQATEILTDSCGGTAPVLTGVKAGVPDNPCSFNGAISILAEFSPDPGVVYSINGIDWQTSNTFINLGPGSYNLFVRNVNDTCKVAWDDNPFILLGDTCFVHIDGQVKAQNMNSDTSLNRIVTADEGNNLSYIDLNELDTVESNQFLDYQHNFTDLGIGYAPGSFYKNRDRVYLGGSVKTVSGRPADGDIIGILPPGYRPSNRILTYGRQQANVVRIDILTTGEVILQSGANNSSNFLSLEGISFRIEPYEIGDIVGGGILFYIAQPGEDLNGDGLADRGLVAAPEDLDDLLPWGCQGTSINEAANTVIGSGQQNTTAIIEECPVETTAANGADDYSVNNHNDWFLPTKDELNLMYQHIGPGATGSNENIGNFAAPFYWSSSESSVGTAWEQIFANGNQGTATKGHEYRVRAVRTF